MSEMESGRSMSQKKNGVEKQVIFACPEVVGPCVSMGLEYTIVAVEEHHGVNGELDSIESLDWSSLESSQEALTKGDSSSVAILVRKSSCGYHEKCLWIINLHTESCKRKAERFWNAWWWMLIAMLSTMVVMCLAAVVAWCIIRPMKPHMEMGGIDFHSLALSSKPEVSLDSKIRQAAYLSANATLQLEMKNPNLVETDYSAAIVSIAYGDTVIAKTTLSAFHQAPHKTAQVNVNLLIDHSDILQSANKLDLLAHITVDDSLPLKVDGQVHARLKILGICTPPIKMSFRCSIEIKVSDQRVSKQECH